MRTIQGTLAAAALAFAITATSASNTIAGTTPIHPLVAAGGDAKSTIALLPYYLHPWWWPPISPPPYNPLFLLSMDINPKSKAADQQVAFGWRQWIDILV